MGQARFRELLTGDAPSPRLDQISLAIASALQPALDEAEWFAALDVIAGECDDPTAEGIAEHLFGELGFMGDRDTYYDWRNSCLDRVIATRTGIPISLSILMIEVGRRLDVGLVGIGMPSHFLVGVENDPDRLFDPFDGGRSLDRGGARDLFETITRGQAHWSDAHLAPTSNRGIAIRMLNNLKVVFARRSDHVRFAIVMQLRSCIEELEDAEAAEIAVATAVFN
jgi:regulator of sirC expression with transglutaminase-like and TPR domain